MAHSFTIFEADKTGLKFNQDTFNYTASGTSYPLDVSGYSQVIGASVFPLGTRTGNETAGMSGTYLVLSGLTTTADYKVTITYR